MLSIENYDLKSLTPNKSPQKQWWTFVHKNNPSHVECVYQYYGGDVKGNEVLVERLKDEGLLQNYYVPTKQFLKKYEDHVERSQTGLQMGHKGTNYND